MPADLTSVLLSDPSTLWPFDVRRPWLVALALALADSQQDSRAHADPGYWSRTAGSERGRCPVYGLKQV